MRARAPRTDAKSRTVAERHVRVGLYVVRVFVGKTFRIERLRVGKVFRVVVYGVHRYDNFRADVQRDFRFGYYVRFVHDSIQRHQRRIFPQRF